MIIQIQMNVATWTIHNIIQLYENLVRTTWFYLKHFIHWFLYLPDLSENIPSLSYLCVVRFRESIRIPHLTHNLIIVDMWPLARASRCKPKPQYCLPYGPHLVAEPGLVADTASKGSNLHFAHGCSKEIRGILCMNDDLGLRRYSSAGS